MPTQCPQCGAALPDEGWEGLCPKCLVRISLGTAGGENAVGSQQAYPKADGSDKAADSPQKTVLIGPSDFLSEHSGASIGRYKLLQQIGEGGFGIVFMAEQTEPVQRKVALKIIKAGMDTREVIARFEAERQALALMDHPNIAQVLDGGATETGRPYFVMELVRGLPITEYCDQANLSTRERLELFIKVCRAVQHAHQKGVIHRDLKPSNVLVTLHDGEPVPKVIDFGVAKALGQKLTDKTLFTRFEQMIGTPAYMSPEQAALSGLDIDTRSDIYSLGVLLYQLLTGVTPLDARTLREAVFDEIRRMICETDPPRPSTRLTELVAADVRRLTNLDSEKDRASLRRLLQQKENLINTVRGDLDWITMKALEKDRRRRYETVNAFTADIERHLRDEPVMARPPSALYRFQKMAHRHRIAFASGAAVAIALVLGLVISTWQAVRATRAERQQSRLRAQAQMAQAGEAAQRQRAEAAVTRLEIERAETLFRADSSSRALAYLARLLRQQPTNRVVAERLLSALSQRSFCLPAAPPLRHGNSLNLSTSVRTNDSVNAAKFSPDGQCVLTAGKDGMARIWDSRTGRPICQPLKHNGEVLWAAFSPDGKRVITASLDQTAQIWDAHTGQPTTPPLAHQGAVLFADFTPDGRKVVTASKDKTVRLWDAQSGLPTSHSIMHGAPVYFASFSADGCLVLTASEDKKARVWQATNGMEIASFKHSRGNADVPFPQMSPDGKRVLTLEGWNAALWEVGANLRPVAYLKHAHEVAATQFSPDGELVATASWDNTVRVWDARTGKAIPPPLKHENHATSVRFSADGRRLISSSDDYSVRIWDVRTGQALTEPLRHESGVWFAEFSPDGQRVLTLTGEGTAWLWDVRSGQPMTELFGHAKDVRHAGFSPDGQRIATAGWDGTARVWNARTGRLLTEIRQAPDYAGEARFSPDGQRLVVTALANVRIWDAATGKALSEPFQSDNKPEADVQHARFSPDGKRVVTGTFRKTAGLWSAVDGQLIARLEHADRVQYAEFSPDGWRIVTASFDGTARLWNSQTGDALFEFKHDAEVTWAEFSPDGQRVATASKDKTARIWEARTGRMLTKPLTHAAQLYEHYSVGFSGDGTRLATAAGNAAQIWDSYSGDPITTPLKHEGRVNAVRFSPDGRRLVTACYDGTARLWDTATGHPLSEPLRHSGRVQYAEFSPNGRYVVTASSDKTARVWEVALAPLPIPAWLPDLAEAVAGQTIDARENSAIVPVEELYKLKQRLGTGQGNDYYQRWVRWFFTDSTAHALTPSSPVTVSEYAREREAQNCYERGGAYSESNQWAQAIAEFTKAIELNSGWDTNLQSKLFAARARAYAATNEFRKAIADLDEVLKQGPEDTNTFAGLHAERAQHLMRVGEPEKALTDFAKAHEASATYLEAYHARGHAYLATDQFRTALADFDEALKRAPQEITNLVHLHLDRADLYARLGDYAKSVPDYEVAIALNPHSDWAYNNLAWHYLAGPRDFRSPEKALPLALKAVELSRTNYLQLNTLGVAYYRVGQLIDAIETLKAGMKEDEAGGGAHDFFFLAMSYQRLGDQVKAENYFTKATNWVATQTNLPPRWKEELESFRAEAEELLGKAHLKESTAKSK